MKILTKILKRRKAKGITLVETAMYIQVMALAIVGLMGVIDTVKQRTIPLMSSARDIGRLVYSEENTDCWMSGSWDCQTPTEVSPVFTLSWPMCFALNPAAVFLPPYYLPPPFFPHCDPPGPTCANYYVGGQRLFSLPCMPGIYTIEGMGTPKPVAEVTPGEITLRFFPQNTIVRLSVSVP